LIVNAQPVEDGEKDFVGQALNAFVIYVIFVNEN
jgi:hypothetical protein